jgi:acetyltransferase-like isoleucine patch superfamily enzyme
MKIGRHSVFAPNLWDIWGLQNELEIGNFTQIAERLTLIGGQAIHVWEQSPKSVSNYGFDERWGISSWPFANGDRKIIIGNDVSIGLDVTLFGGITIGDGAIIGAKSVVRCDVPAYSIFVGNPARPAKLRYEKAIVEKLLQIKWWEWSDEVIKERLPDFHDVQEFTRKYHAPSSQET